MTSHQCTSCLDDERCWVCLGTGLLDTRGGTPQPCHRCFGSGACPDCQTITIEDVGQSPVLNPFRRRRARRSA
ncbi:MAG TPA: hypothetical protein VFJ17_04075 [Mycobacteriales bacterium]|nr:hypothetical protein [Mycobacteriales bacterium]